MFSGICISQILNCFAIVLFFWKGGSTDNSNCVCVRVTKRKDYKMITWKGWVTVKGMRGRIMLFFYELKVDI